MVSLSAMDSQTASTLIARHLSPEPSRSSFAFCATSARIPDEDVRGGLLVGREVVLAAFAAA
jgi:hypothetical protein